MPRKPVSQIYIADAPAPDLPPFLQSATASVKDAFAGYDYTLYGGAALRRFIAAEFERDVLAAFDALAPYAYKADLGKYCLLFKKGGWAVDIGVQFIAPVTVPDNVRMIVFRDTGIHTQTSWATSCALVYAEPGHVACRRAIELIVDNCRNDYYGVTPLCPTGPNLFGEAIASTRCKEGLLVGDAIDLTPAHPMRNRSYVLPDGTICARRKPAEGGDLTSLGGVGTNNYNTFWNERRVYGGSVA